MCTIYKGTDIFEYRLVPLPGITRNPIFHAKDAYPFPYITMPILRLPILPHFAIVDFALKYAKHDMFKIRSTAETGPYFKNLYEELSGCDCIYQTWLMAKVPLPFLQGSGDGDTWRAVGPGGNPFRRKDAYVFLPEDPASIWDGDQVGLRPLDSVTHTSDEGEDDFDEGEDEDCDEDLERYSVLNARVRQWIGDVGPYHAREEHAGNDLSEIKSATAVPDLIPSDDDSDDSDGGSSSMIATVKGVNVGTAIKAITRPRSQLKARRVTTGSHICWHLYNILDIPLQAICISAFAAYISFGYNRQTKLQNRTTPTNVDQIHGTSSLTKFQKFSNLIPNYLDRYMYIVRVINRSSFAKRPGFFGRSTTTGKLFGGGSFPPTVIRGSGSDATHIVVLCEP
ncbi:hypothetical protein H0H93_003644 [Arthromyces matolae]|nr:hypothetical protein H0H93_003644 [Arthromyces matolae]